MPAHTQLEPTSGDLGGPIGTTTGILRVDAADLNSVVLAHCVNLPAGAAAVDHPNASETSGVVALARNSRGEADALSLSPSGTLRVDTGALVGLVLILVILQIGQLLVTAIIGAPILEALRNRRTP